MKEDFIQIEDERKFNIIQMDFDLDRIPMSDRAFRLYLLFSKMSATKGYCWPALTTIAAHVWPDLSPRRGKQAVIDAIKELEAHGLIEKIKRFDPIRGGYTSNIYRIRDKSKWTTTLKPEIKSKQSAKNDHYPSAKNDHYPSAKNDHYPSAKNDHYKIVKEENIKIEKVKERESIPQPSVTVSVSRVFKEHFQKTEYSKAISNLISNENVERLLSSTKPSEFEAWLRDRHKEVPISVMEKKFGELADVLECEPKKYRNIKGAINTYITFGMKDHWQNERAKGSYKPSERRYENARRVPTEELPF